MPILVIPSVAKDLTERSDTDRVAGVRSFAPLRATEERRSEAWRAAFDTPSPSLSPERGRGI
jgi:hypothetical protein